MAEDKAAVAGGSPAGQSRADSMTFLRGGKAEKKWIARKDESAGWRGL